jgi:hypothetical protein
LTERTGEIQDAELDAFRATLPAASIDFMIGEWMSGEASQWMVESAAR